MKTNPEIAGYIKIRFKKIKNGNELLFLLNYINREIFSDKQKFSLNYINDLIQNGTSSRYTTFSIVKKSGGMREIYSPEEELKKIQQCLNVLFQSVYEAHPAAMGFVPERSIVTNAKLHTGKSYVYNVDLKDFFFSIDQRRIWGRLQYPPFNLNSANKKIVLADIISKLCCTDIEVERFYGKYGWKKVLKNVVPQGAPTSPFLSNIICQKLDYQLSAVAKRFGLEYSRYADDITFSSNTNVFYNDSPFIKEFTNVINGQNFYINEKKIRLQNEFERQSVTGITVNKKTNLPKKYVKEIRMFLYYWETYGYDRATVLYNNSADKIAHDKNNLKNVIKGKLMFLKMVRGETDNCFFKLNSRYVKLCGRN